MNKNLLEIKNISKIYEGKKKERSRQVRALDNVSIEFPEKGFVFVNGISGSGKTTLLNILSGIDNLYSGEIYFEGNNITAYSEKQWDTYRNLKVGIVFQSFNLIDDMTVKENILLPLKIQKSEEEMYENTALEILQYVGLQELAERKCTELSAGQRQRVAIARAMIKRPKILLADEATGNLDPKNTESVLKLFNDISKRCLVILISHDNISAGRYGDRIITLSEGKVISDVDNSRIKNLCENEYSVALESGSETKKIVLDQFDLKKEIVALAKWNGEVFNDIKMKLHIFSEHKKSQKQEEKWNRTDAEAKSLPARDIVGHSICSIKKSKVKSVLIICLIAFMCSLFFMANILSSNDYIRSISDYIDHSENNLFMVEQHVRTEENDKVISCGKAFLEALQEDVENNFVKYREDVNIVLKKGDISIWVNLFFGDNIDKAFSVRLDGTYPADDNQIAISSQIASKNSIALGDKIEVNGMVCTVCGIYDSDNEIVGNSAVVSETVSGYDIVSGQSVGMQGIDITLSANKSAYAYGINTIGSLKQITSSEELVWGRMPESDNEFLVSSELAETLGDYLKGDFVTSYRIPDLYDKKYNDEYSDRLNLYDYMGKKVEIVGIYDSELLSEIGNIIVTEKVYRSLMEDYLKYFHFEGCMVYFGEDSYEYLCHMSDDKIEICEDACTRIYTVKKATEKVKQALSIIILVFFIMLAFVLISFLAYHVKDNSKRIGILRALGVGSKDIRKIFLLSNTMISMISVVLSGLTVIAISGQINRSMRGWMEAERMNTITIHYGYLLFLCGIVIIMGMIITAIPLKVNSHKKAIKLLNE